MSFLSGIGKALKSVGKAIGNVAKTVLNPKTLLNPASLLKIGNIANPIGKVLDIGKPFVQKGLTALFGKKVGDAAGKVIDFVRKNDPLMKALNSKVPDFIEKLKNFGLGQGMLMPGQQPAQPSLPQMSQPSPDVASVSKALQQLPIDPNLRAQLESLFQKLSADRNAMISVTINVRDASNNTYSSSTIRV